MNIPENVEFYVALVILTALIFNLGVLIYMGRQKEESRSRYYARLLPVIGLIVIMLFKVTEIPDWLDETLLFIAAGIFIASFVLMIRG